MEKVDICIRELSNSYDIDLALNLAYDIYKNCNSIDYTEDGIKHFREFIFTDKYKDGLTIYGAFHSSGSLVGMIGYRYKIHHLAMLFVQEQYHNLGIGFKLLKFIVSHEQSGIIITVNSSTYAEKIYEHFGFKHKTNYQDEVTYNGLSFYQMEYKV